MAGTAVTDRRQPDHRRPGHRRRRRPSPARGGLRQRRPGSAARFRALAAEHLEVIAGDIGEPNLGLDEATWERLAQRVDLIVHPAALVNHVLPYRQLFGPNVVGTAELIRLAITARIKPVTYLSTVRSRCPSIRQVFDEDGDIRDDQPGPGGRRRYANGYANSKWAGEVLLREAHDLCGLPVAVFRSDMILAHHPIRTAQCAGRLHPAGAQPSGDRHRAAVVLPNDADGDRQRAHYDGLPVDFVAESITTLGRQATDGFRSFDVMNPHDDGISLDTFVDWLIAAGHDRAHRRYHDWLARFETALTALPDAQRQQSVLPLLDVYRIRAAAARRHRPDRGFPRRGAGGRCRRRRRHPPPHGGADRQVRQRPAGVGAAVAAAVTV